VYKEGFEPTTLSVYLTLDRRTALAPPASK
jgi:hypothetical protein